MKEDIDTELDVTKTCINLIVALSPDSRARVVGCLNTWMGIWNKSPEQVRFALRDQIINLRHKLSEAESELSKLEEKK